MEPKFNKHGEPIFEIPYIPLPECIPAKLEPKSVPRFCYILRLYLNLEELWTTQLGKIHLKNPENIKVAHEFWCQNGPRTWSGKCFPFSKTWITDAMEQMVEEMRQLVGCPKNFNPSYTETQPQASERPAHSPFETRNIFGGGPSMQRMSRSLKKVESPKTALKGLSPLTRQWSQLPDRCLETAQSASANRQDSASTDKPQTHQSESAPDRLATQVEAKEEADSVLAAVETDSVTRAQKRQRSEDPTNEGGSPPAKRERMAKLGRKVAHAAAAPVRRSQRLLSRLSSSSAVPDQPEPEPEPADEEATGDERGTKLKKALKRVLPSRKRK